LPLRFLLFLPLGEPASRVLLPRTIRRFLFLSSGRPYLASPARRKLRPLSTRRRLAHLEQAARRRFPHMPWFCTLFLKFVRGIVCRAEVLLLTLFGGFVRIAIFSRFFFTPPLWHVYFAGSDFVQCPPQLRPFSNIDFSFGGLGVVFFCALPFPRPEVLRRFWLARFLVIVPPRLQQTPPFLFGSLPFPFRADRPSPVDPPQPAPDTIACNDSPVQPSRKRTSHLICSPRETNFKTEFSSSSFFPWGRSTVIEAN